MSVNGVRIIFVIAFLSNMVLPFAGYHSTVEPYITDVLWGFKLPVGWAGLAIGLLLLGYPRTQIAKRLGLGRVMLLGSLVFLVVGLITQRGGSLWINLWHGTNIQGWDTDVISFLPLVPFLISFSGVYAGVILFLNQRYANRLNHPIQ